MRTRSHTMSFAVSLLILPMLAAVPIEANENPVQDASTGLEAMESASADQLSLNLEETLAAQGLRVEIDAPDITPSKKPQTIEITRQGLVAARDSYAMSQDSTDPASSDAPAKKKGGWWKRHWYIPAAAAVILGAVLIGDDDNDKGELEDD